MKIAEILDEHVKGRRAKIYNKKPVATSGPSKPKPAPATVKPEAPAATTKPAKPATPKPQEPKK